MADAPMTLDKLRELRDEYYRHISLAPSPGYADDRMHTALTYAVAEIERLTRERNRLLVVQLAERTGRISGKQLSDAELAQLREEADAIYESAKAEPPIGGAEAK